MFIDNYYTLSALVLFVLLQLNTLGWVFYKTKKKSNTWIWETESPEWALSDYWVFELTHDTVDSVT